jgi:hypothetical protein
MIMCFTWFLISGLEEPNIYHDLGMFYKNVGRGRTENSGKMVRSCWKHYLAESAGSQKMI